MSKSGSHGTLTVWLAKSEEAAINPTTPEAEAVVVPVVVPPVGALVEATVVAVEVGREVVGLVTAGGLFQSEVIGFSQNQGVQLNGGQ